MGRPEHWKILKRVDDAYDATAKTRRREYAKKHNWQSGSRKLNLPTSNCQFMLYERNYLSTQP